VGQLTELDGAALRLQGVHNHEYRKTHPSGGAAANLASLCVDALNQRAVELGKEKQGPATLWQDEIFS
jgi:hypothetical protein